LRDRKVSGPRLPGGANFISMKKKLHPNTLKPPQLRLQTREM
jgi:hypothetical protein